MDGLLDTATLGKLAPLVVGLLTGLAEGRQELVRRLRSEGRSFRKVANTCGVSLATAHRYGFKS